MSKEPIDETGIKYGKLRILGIANLDQRDPHKKWYKEYWVRCDCGRRKVVLASNIGRHGTTKSCGNCDKSKSEPARANLLQIYLTDKEMTVFTNYAKMIDYTNSAAGFVALMRGATGFTRDGEKRGHKFVRDAVKAFMRMSGRTKSSHRKRKDRRTI